MRLRREIGRAIVKGSAMIGDEARWQITVARLCEKYHCLPSDLERERADDVEMLLNVMRADAERDIEQYKKTRK